jgi:hypothetical protein
VTELLQKAFDEVSKLPTTEQDDLASWILEELASERRWAAAFAHSGNALDRLAGEALAEHKEGRTVALDSNKL